MDMSGQSWVISVLVCLTFAHLTQSTRPIRYISCEYQHCDGRTQYCDKLTGSCSGCRAPCSRTTEADEKLCQTECQAYLALLTTPSPTDVVILSAASKPKPSGSRTHVVIGECFNSAYKLS
ncbi:hypothetical protein NP493_99g01028 [Ridgeia piscesae]|uniref:TNFR-Cys domain-containing protein n=1 Tax=Ridgeia piscesae TaxID=27915 RepID=A0AAD9P7N6_RIDPI|nr:hypothetical protein NP493_99g01028 [Ridgeia piscesae]